MASALGSGIVLLLVLQTVTAHFLHGAFGFTEHPQHLHLIGGVRFADFAHRKADVYQDPIARPGAVIFQKSKIDFAPHADNINNRQASVFRIQLDNSSGYRQAHRSAPFACSKATYSKATHRTGFGLRVIRRALLPGLPRRPPARSIPFALLRDLDFWAHSR